MESRIEKHLETLLDMSKVNFSEMSDRWSDFNSKTNFSIKNSEDFIIGYVFGKIEHKFISWFYSEFGRAQTDPEYEEFCSVIRNRIKKWKIKS